MILIKNLTVTFKRAGVGARKKSRAPGDLGPAIVPESLARGGVSLGERAQAFAERIFGRRFENVRIHAGPADADEAKALGAEAFTVANHIYFDTNKFGIDSPEGRGLLAHELTHVVQAEREGDEVQRKPVGSSGSDDAKEREARALEASVRARRPAPRSVAVGHITPGPVLFRKAKSGAPLLSGTTRGERRELHRAPRDTEFVSGVGDRARHAAARGSLPSAPPREVSSRYQVVGFTEVAYGMVTRSWGRDDGAAGCYTTTATVTEAGGQSYELIRIWALERQPPTIFRPDFHAMLPGLTGQIGMEVLHGEPVHPAQADISPQILQKFAEGPVDLKPTFASPLSMFMPGFMPDQAVPVPVPPPPRPIRPTPVAHADLGGRPVPSGPILEASGRATIRDQGRAVDTISEIFQEALAKKIGDLMRFDDAPDAFEADEAGPGRSGGGTLPPRGCGFVATLLGALKAGLSLAAKIFNAGAQVVSGLFRAGKGLAQAITGALKGFGSGGIGGAKDALPGVQQAAQGIGGAVDKARGLAAGLGIKFSSRPGTLDVGSPEMELAAEANERAVMSDLGGAPRDGGPFARSPAVQGGRLTGPTLEYVEGFFGRSFGDVRIHTEPEAGQAADVLGAHAFATGNDIYFGRHEFRPDTPQGMALLVHELTHVVQQGDGVRRSALAGVSADWFAQLHLGFPGGLFGGSVGGSVAAGGLTAGGFLGWSPGGGFTAGGFLGFPSVRPAVASDEVREIARDQRAASRVAMLPGMAIPHDVRRKLEERIDADLTRVRLHTGPEAAVAARGMGADAFAHGESVVLGEEAAADLAAGHVGTLAHELEHVRQYQQREHLGSRGPIAREVLEETAKEAERELPTFTRIAGIGDFLRSPGTVQRVAEALPEELAMLRSPTKRPKKTAPPPDEKKKDEEGDDGDPQHIIHQLMGEYQVRPTVGEEDFIDEIAERIRDLMEEELRIERERGCQCMEAPF